MKQERPPNKIAPDAPAWRPTPLGWSVEIAGVVCEVRKILRPDMSREEFPGCWFVFDAGSPKRRGARVPNKKRAVEELRGLLLGRLNEMLTVFGYEEIKE